MSKVINQPGGCLGDYFNQRQEPGRTGLPVMSVTMNDSLVLRDDIDRRLESALRPDQHLLVRKGDIAYNMMRMWQGACGLALHDGIISPAYVVLEPKPSIDSRFAYHWFKSSRILHMFWAYSHGLTEDRLRLYFDNFCEIPATPPPLDQQRLIADVLDTWDGAITEIEKLIEQRQLRKKGLRRRLLSDLPRRPFLEAIDLTISGVDKKTISGEQPVLLCNYMDVFHNSHITSRIDFMRATATAREIENQRLHLNDVVFTKDSETPEEIAEPALIAEEIESLICGYHLAIARPKPGIAHGPFIAQAMADPEIRWQFRRLSNGVVRFGLTLEAIESVEIFLPNIWTQERIAGVLEAEDAAIDSLTRSVKLLRDQKRGVSQKLLHSGSPLNAAIWPTNNGHRKSAKVNKR
jgi:type I restriction enzyme, S subunit